MPVFLLVVGAVFLIVAVRGNDAIDLFTATLKDDFSGPGNFLVWALSIGGIAAIGSFKQFRPVARAGLALLFVAILLNRRGPNGEDFFTSFIRQIRGTEK